MTVPPLPTVPVDPVVLTRTRDALAATAIVAER
jgi:hypothetical protein